MSIPSAPGFKAAPHILALLDRLHAESATQESSIDPLQVKEIRSLYHTNPEDAKKELDALMLDKFIALERDKCHFVHHLLLAIGAKCVVEVGTSFGVSTIYLALAAGQNSSNGRVIATEKEALKAAKAREYWREAGAEVLNHIELREGDLLETLQQGVEDVDMLLLDIWPYVALPALKLVQPRLRPGAVIITDNIVQAADGYKELQEYLMAPDSPFQNTTLPYKGGLQMSVYVPRSS